MYQNLYFERGKRSSDPVHIWIWDDQNKNEILEFDYQPYAFRKSTNGSYKSIYGDTLDKITEYRYDDPTLFESDVNIETRVLIDCYTDSDEPSIGNRVLTFDIETDSTDGFPNVKTADKEINAISGHYNGKYSAFTLDRSNKIKDRSSGDLELFSFQTEEDLLSSFISYWRNIKPTIVTGWNITGDGKNSTGFDIPYFIRRVNRVLGDGTANQLSEIGRIKYSSHYDSYTIAGVSCLDYLLLYKKYTEKMEPNYRLGYIGKKSVGIDKIEYKGSLQNLYDTDIEKFIDYNVNDVKIVVALDEKYKYIDLARAVCHKGHVNYENFPISSKFIEGAMLTYMRRKNLVAPNKPKVEEDYDYENDKDGFDGAYVKEPVPGLYNWVFDLDLTSLYPSIMLSLNISSETKVGKLLNWDNERFLKGELKEVLIEGNDYGVYSSDFKQFIEENKYSISSNGIMYKTDKQGIICEILDKWFDERVEFRKLEKKFGGEKNHDKYMFYNQRQRVQKVLLNSVYGVLGLKSYRFHDFDNAAAVTATGQTIIKTTGKIINQFYNKKVNTKDVDYVTYSDTDSTFISAEKYIKSVYPEIDLSNESVVSEVILKIASEFQKNINDTYDVLAKKLFFIDTHRFFIKQEYIAKSAIWLAKKRYAQWIINEGGLPRDEIKVTGLDVVRSSFPEQFKKCMEHILKSILEGKDKKFIDSYVLEFKEKLVNFKPSEIAKNTSVALKCKTTGESYDPKNRDIFHYVKGTTGQAKAALAYNDLLKKYNLDKKVTPIYNGGKIKWVYLKNNNLGLDCLAFKDDDTDPKQIVDFIEKYIDRERLFESELMKKLTGFYESMKWEMFSANALKASQFFDF